jgi:hypothetical protein
MRSPTISNVSVLPRDASFLAHGTRRCSKNRMRVDVLEVSTSLRALARNWLELSWSDGEDSSSLENEPGRPLVLIQSSTELIGPYRGGSKGRKVTD